MAKPKVMVALCDPASVDSLAILRKLGRGGRHAFAKQRHVKGLVWRSHLNWRPMRQNPGHQSNAISVFHSFQTLPTRSALGLSVALPGRQPDGVAWVPMDSRTSWKA
jgi:hypothetical protein